MDTTPTPKWMIQNERLYDTLKYFAMIVLPAGATLYFALSQVWGLPFGEEIVGTIAAVDAFLGVVLRISTNAYSTSDARFDGTLNVHETEETKLFQLEIDGDPYQLGDKDTLTFRVKRD